MKYGPSDNVRASLDLENTPPAKMDLVHRQSTMDNRQMASRIGLTVAIPVKRVYLSRIKGGLSLETGGLMSGKGGLDSGHGGLTNGRGWVAVFKGWVGLF